MSDGSPTETCIKVVIIDVAARAREMFGSLSIERIFGREIPEHDYRIEAVTATGHVTFHQGATADDVVAYLAQRTEQLPIPSEEQQ